MASDVAVIVVIVVVSAVVFAVPFPASGGNVTWTTTVVTVLTKKGVFTLIAKKTNFNAKELQAPNSPEANASRPDGNATEMMTVTTGKGGGKGVGECRWADGEVAVGVWEGLGER